MGHYAVSGRFQSRDGFQPFRKTVEAPNENVAREYAYSQLGSQHNLRRNQIDLEEVSAA